MHLKMFLKKHDENVIAASDNFRQIDAKGNIVYAPGKKVSLIGVENLVIVSHGDEIMVLPKALLKELRNYQ